MLDVQRQRTYVYRVEVHFTRRILLGHLALGVMIVLMLTAHGVGHWAFGAALWYLLSILPILGMKSGRPFCRHFLGLLFLLFSSSGVYFLAKVEPSLPPETAPMISTRLLPFWLGCLNLLYAIAGFCLMLHQHVRRAVTIGFTLW